MMLKWTSEYSKYKTLLRKRETALTNAFTESSTIKIYTCTIPLVKNNSLTDNVYSAVENCAFLFDIRHR